MSETFVCVDIEASGPVPGEYSMLSLGACVVGDTGQNLYFELKPLHMRFVPEALAVAGLDLHTLARRGVEPKEGMARFERWLASVTPAGQRPIFVAYPLAFDWMFVAYYFHRFLGRNPFGISGLDLRSYYAGMLGTDWEGTTRARMETQLGTIPPLTHNALEDANVQARLFERMLDFRRQLSGISPRLER